MDSCIEAVKQACSEVDRALETQTEEEYMKENVSMLQDALHAECRATHEKELLALWKVIGAYIRDLLLLLIIFLSKSFVIIVNEEQSICGFRGFGGGTVTV